MDLKIIFSGFSKAGKTSIIRTLDKDTVENIRPTINMEVTEVRFLGIDILCVDIGGQKTYRDQFMQNFDLYIKGTHIILYVLSVQDEKDEKESLEFLEMLLNRLEKSGVEAHLGILLHKLDPTVKNLAKVAKYANKLEKKVQKVLAGYGGVYYLFRTSIFDPSSLMEAFTQVLNSRFPKGEYVTYKIQEICEAVESPMGMAHVVGGDKDHPFLLGRFIQPGSDVEDAVRFIKKTYELVDEWRVRWSDDNTILFPLSENLEIIARSFYVGKLMAIYATALPLQKYRQDVALQATLDGNIDEIRKLLETITIGSGLI